MQKLYQINLLLWGINTPHTHNELFVQRFLQVAHRNLLLHENLLWIK